MESELKFVERRAHPRSSVSFGLVLISGRRIFRTSCSNVSIGGLQLSVAPPQDYLMEDLSLVLLSPDDSNNLLTKINFVDGESKMRIAFQDLTSEQERMLQSWILSESNLLKAA